MTTQNVKPRDCNSDYNPSKKEWKPPTLKKLNISETAFKPPGGCDATDEYCDRTS